MIYSSTALEPPKIPCEFCLPMSANRYVTLPRDENQAHGLGRYAIDFLSDARLNDLHAGPSAAALQMVERFHLDSVACGVSALACQTNAPTVLRAEALDYRLRADQANVGAYCFGSTVPVRAEKAVLANSAAVREWDANGTNFGYNPSRGQTAGEFGHNDFYPVAVAAAQLTGADGKKLLAAMLCLDEIRGRLAEAFALKNYKIDHVVHGAIAAAAVYGAMLGASAERIESAIGMLVAHYIPFRAIRAGKQLSDSKGASAAMSAEMALVCVHRAIRGFVGPADIFRNPEAIFCLFQPPATAGVSPFDLTLTTAGDDFAVQGMHFKLGLYEHQSAGAIGGLISLLTAHPQIVADPNQLKSLRITIYEPAFGIIGDPAKRDPRTRQSADHSMLYIIATLLRKAYQTGCTAWKDLMLLPVDYDDGALFDPLTRQIMNKIQFVHGGADYDRRYPDGIPTTLEIDHAELGGLSSGLVMYPEGHARNRSGNLDGLLEYKFRKLASLGVDDVDALHRRFTGLADKPAQEIATLYDFRIRGLPS